MDSVTAFSFQNSYKHRDSSSVTSIHDYDNPFTNKHSKYVADKFPFYGDDTENLNNSEPIVDKFGKVSSLLRTF